MDNIPKNLYKFEDSPVDSSSTSPTSSSNGMNIPIDVLKDLGGVPLPKDGEMGKWFVVIAVIVVVAALWFVGSWINGEMKFKNDQIQSCSENFQSLNVKYILKEQELLQMKNPQDKNTNHINNDDNLPVVSQ